MATQQDTITVNDKTYEVRFDFDYNTVEFLDNTGRIQPVAADTSAYPYTHGGEAYKAACERFWALEEEQDG